MTLIRKPRIGEAIDLENNDHGDTEWEYAHSYIAPFSGQRHAIYSGTEANARRDVTDLLLRRPEVKADSIKIHRRKIVRHDEWDEVPL